MRTPKAIELFLAVGLATTVVACAGGDTATEGDTDTVAEAPAEVAEGGEGGEGGEGADYSAGEQANADFEDKVSGPELLSALQEGGHVIYFRHAQTERDYADQADPNMDVNDCETQRKLSDVGIQQAQDIGVAFTEQDIPVGDVISSEYCRAWQTADLAFGRYEKNAKLNFLPFEEYTDAQVEEMQANVMPLLTAVPADGQNTVIVGHDDIFEAATGIYPDPQGLAYVLTPDGAGGFDLVANVLPEEWAQL
ncbi:histidine phosphatase family protein [Leptolyngbya cf. ectocarpi LEGE 11479]|uniref:Histidine phosphatase family protein n=1 Tax=Leptolyngbya cf. ectocarpi LEGE 11479 TaxID=1828722 RepID=A0A928X455_LEPEC|nr:histidine phosphatase family protein [Leptolyngbya ectocarpi]MBE9066218.1 histidine phosphatase family protein [Leptolyngbya cf. ectocarpi LEGE 11479]